MESLSKQAMRQTRGGGTLPDDHAAIAGIISATWPGPDSPFPPPPGALALFAELNGLTVQELQEILRTL